MVRLRNLQLKSPRLRIKRLAKVAQLKSSRRKRRGVNYISAARKARTGNVASSSSQRTWNCGNIAGEVDIGDFINFLREKFGCQGTSMNHQRHMTVTGGFSRMNLFWEGKIPGSVQSGENCKPNLAIAKPNPVRRGSRSHAHCNVVYIFFLSFWRIFAVQLLFKYL